ncbi:MAG: hypothetical protein L0Y58_00465, partial [Verrucomicrobia subdivision 3 bacterium]|nr:hypothetical protein [Limisphaerales bacterium]
MKFRYIAGEWKRYALAATGGLLLAAAFPKIGLAGLGWIAPGILLASGLGAAPWAAFRSGFVGGFAFFLAALYWLLLIPVPVAPIVGWLALSAFLSLYSGLWVWLVWRACPARFDGASTTTELLERFLETSWRQRFVWSVFAAVAWVAWEMTQARFLSGFPWTLLGASQYRILPLIQISSVTGVYGVSFLLVWFSAAVLCACVGLARRPGKRTWSAEIFAPALVIVALIGWGMQRMKGLALEGTRTLRVALVQPSIPQTVIWNQAPEEKARRFASLMALSEAALTKKPALLVWPEAALPDLLRWSTNEYSGKTLLQTVTGLARQHGVWMVVGA